MDNLHFDFRQLRAYIAVTETGSFTLAAQQLQMTQSAISQIIKNMESNLHTELIDRKKRPVRLTIAGQELRNYGLKLLSDSKQLQERLYAIEKGQIPKLRLGVVDSIGQIIGLGVLKYLQPKVNQIHQITGTAPDLLQALQQGKIDLVLSMMHTQTPEKVALFPLINEKYLVVTPQSWPAQSLENLCQSKSYIAYAGWTPTGSQTTNWLKWRNFKPHIQFEIARADHVLELIAAGDGWTLATPSFLASDPHLIKQFNLTPLPGPGLSRNLVALCQEGEMARFMPAFVADTKRMLCDALSPYFKDSWTLL